MRLGEILLERRLLSAAALERPLELQEDRRERIGTTLAALGFVTLRAVLAAA